MGYVIISPLELVEKYIKNESIPILPGEDGHTWGGCLYVDEIEICKKDSNYCQVPPPANKQSPPSSILMAAST